MNVIRTEAALQPPNERYGARPVQEFNVPVTKHQFGTKRKWRRNLTSASSGCCKTPRYTSAVRGGRGQPISSFVTSASRNFASRSATRTTTGAGSSLLESVDSDTVLAITTGRGDARFEVGMAALDVRCPHLILCQISDSQIYRNALSKLYLFDPIEAVMPDTMCGRTADKTILYRSIMDKFPEIEVTGISRVHFNATVGLERIKQLCNAEYSSVELFVKQKYYALAAAAALLKYVEYVLHIVYAPKSMKIEFQGSPNATTIDLESARSLELVQSQCGQRNVNLLGILDHCSTPMGRKLLRANILQPPSEERVILERQAAVAEFVSNPSLRALIQPIVRRLHGADRLLALSTTPVLQENNVQGAEHNLNYVLLLKNLLDAVPELANILLSSKSDLVVKIQKKLEREEFLLMRQRILETIHPDARSVTGYTSSNMQRCFAIKAGINDLLDVARQTYCELIDDIKTMVENLASKYQLSLSLSCNASLGYHIRATLPRSLQEKGFDPPSEFTEVRKNKRTYTMTTSALSIMSQQCKIACEELHLMSNVLLCDLLENIREYIGCMFQLSADVAELDLALSLSQVSSQKTYVRPTFGAKLDVHDSRHPVMDVFDLDGLIPNDIKASVTRNLCVISGPNMSGKSTYLKQIVLLHVMAQIGCFVPATKATFRITNLIFCKIAVRDDIEYNASTFALEMKEAQYILRSVGPTSLIVLDELCKGTAVEDGASIAWAICEKLLQSSAFIFAVTHFFYLTKLPDLYCNATNQHFETANVRVSEGIGSHYRITYTHRLKSGVAPTDDYGIALAELSGLPKPITERAREYASERVIHDRVQVQSNAWERSCYAALVKLHEHLEGEQSNREQVDSLIECFLNLSKQQGLEEERRGEEDEADMGEQGEAECLEDGASNTTIYSRESFSETDRLEGTHKSGIFPSLDSQSEESIATVLMQLERHDADASTNALHPPREPTRLHNDSLNLERSKYCLPRNPSFNSIHPLSFCSDATDNACNQFENLLPPSGSLTFRSTGNSLCSTFPTTIPPLSPSHSRGSLSPFQSCIPTLHTSISPLYEYCLSDHDLQPSDLFSASLLADLACTARSSALNASQNSQ